MNQILNSTVSTPSAVPDTACGPLRYTLLNDYLFKALLQENNRVLKGLICSLLHLSPAEVSSVVITNPMELGKTITDKTFLLDVRVLLNNSTLINLELQVINQGNWPERSMSYLCRSFDNLNKGDNYRNVKPVIHIGFLDFTLFPESPEFYATNMLMNVKNNTIYSDKMRLCVVDLTQIEHATDEDKAYQIDYWASLFKATTWEEIKMLASKNETLNEAANTLYKLSEEEKVRLQCEALEEYNRIERTWEILLEEANAEKEAAYTALKGKDAELESKNAELESKNAELESKDAELEGKDAEIAKLRAELEKQKNPPQA